METTKHDSLCELLTASDSTLLSGYVCGCAERERQRNDPAPYKPLTRRQAHKGWSGRTHGYRR